MNKAVMWIGIIVIALIVLGGIWYVSQNAASSSQEPIDTLPDSAFDSIESTDEIFNEIDDSLNYVE